MKNIKTIRDLVKEYPKMYDYDYKWTDSENFKNLDSVLELLGYTFKDEEDWEILGDYNDIKAYFNIVIIKI